MKNYRVWMAAGFIIYMFSDLARRFTDGSKALLVLFDLMVLVSYAAFFTTRRPTLGRSAAARVLLAMMGAFALLVVAQCLNPSPYARYFVTKVFAVRNYLLALPCVFLGYDLASSTDSRQALRRWSRLVRWLFVALVAFGVVTYFVRGGGETDNAMLKPMAGAMRHFHSAEVKLSSSAFATSVKFAIFILGGYLFLWASAKRHKDLFWPITVVAFAGMYVSGSRALLTVFAVFVVMSAVLFRNRGTRGQNPKLVLSAVVGMTLLLGGMAFQNDLRRGLDAGGDHKARAAYLIQGREEYLTRTQMAASPILLRPNNPDLIFGIGVGTFGQSTFAVPTLIQARFGIIRRFFNETPGMPVGDSGLTKICIETGVVGLAVVLAMFLYILWLSATCIWKSGVRGDPFGFAMGFFPFAWFVIFLKGHQILAGLEASCFLYLGTGFVLRSLEEASAEAR